MPLTTEQLMMPRYKVIALYPKCPFEIGEILIQDFETSAEVFINEETQRVNRFGDDWIHPKIVVLYPHLFQPLQWWMERDKKDLPEYVRYSRGVFKVKNWQYSPGGEILFDIFNWRDKNVWSSSGGNFWVENTKLLPATEAEYQTTKNNQK